VRSAERAIIAGIPEKVYQQILRLDYLLSKKQTSFSIITDEPYPFPPTKLQYTEHVILLLKNLCTTNRARNHSQIKWS